MWRLKNKCKLSQSGASLASRKRQQEASIVAPAIGHYYCCFIFLLLVCGCLRRSAKVATAQVAPLFIALLLALCVCLFLTSCGRTATLALRAKRHCRQRRALVARFNLPDRKQRQTELTGDKIGASALRLSREGAQIREELVWAQTKLDE